MTVTTSPPPKVLLPSEPKILSLSPSSTHFLNRWRPSPESLVFISALLVGGGSGLLMVLFHTLINFFYSLSFEGLMSLIYTWGAWTLALIPVLGGLMIGVMRWLFPKILGQDFSTLLTNARVQDITPLRPFVKMLAAAISLGTGASLGPESPSVEIGSHVGILYAQFFQVSQERYRLLLGAGAAAGLAAGFNAPIAGVFFALEVVLGATFFTAPATSLILLSAVFSSIVSRIFLGAHPAFILPDYQVISSWEWIFYVGLGVLASCVSLAYTQGIKWMRACFQGEIRYLSFLGKIPPFLKPALGGIIIGLIALKLPQTLGVSYQTLEIILQGERFPLLLLGLLLIFKLIATTISLGSGFVGGVFAPAMFLGACLGAIYGHVLGLILPSDFVEISPPAAYATVGMAAVLASSVRAPLTAILLLFEMTRNYLIILPLMVTVGVSIAVMDCIKAKSSVAGLNLQQMGMNLAQQNEQEILQKVPIATLMDFSYLTLLDSISLIEAGQKMIQAKCHTALVVDETKLLVGVITLADIKRNLIQIQSILSEKANFEHTLSEMNLKIGEICTSEILYVHPEDSVSEAFEQMRVRGLFLLPVVHPDNPRKIIGVLDKNKMTLASDLVSTQTVLVPYSTVQN
ncbi:chloride channel protein [Limnoraphis robusta]|uniref:Cl-channel voltage-gated family protein n=1 Tax=Limnoraphis robusta CS-951 TaxID=1637645 RepID=A0A0F5YJQ8_9CYAN|nr:chloride channel protein [Limnoraphis robusta]KKD38425.1 Cl- channel voltage-gated family protein [Limnoraphis robusta CS-951]